MPTYQQDNYTVRQFMPADWLAFKNIRLEAAMIEPNVFVRLYHDELYTPDVEWQARVADEDRATFALLHWDEVVGMSAIALHSRNPSIGVMVASYIRPGHRGKGLSNLFYQARIDWAVKRKLHLLIVSHRKDNEASAAAICKHHFIQTSNETRRWPDGVEEEQLFYELDLKKL